MAKIILACRQKPLAAFIENVLAELNVECRSVVDSAALPAAAAEFQPDIILVNSGFPEPDENSVLLAELKDSGLEIPLLSICEPVEDKVADVAGDKPPEIPDVLRLPFAEKDLRKKIESLTGIAITEKSAPATAAAVIDVASGEDLRQNLQPEKAEDGTMDKVKTAVKTFELTEIVEEGLPLDELPERCADSGSMAGPGAVAADFEASGTEPVVSQDVAELVAEDLDFDDFGGSLDDLETDLQESGAPESTPVETVAADDIAASLESVAAATAPAAEDTLAPAAAMAADGENGVELSPDLPDSAGPESAGKAPEPVAGDLDALLDDNDFVEVEIPEEEDPVLSGLKKAGLTPEAEVTPAAAEPAAEPVGTGLNEVEDLLDADEAAAEIAAPVAADAVAADAAEFIEMPRPEEVAVPDLAAVVAPAPLAAEGRAEAAATEVPEDYLEDEELMSATAEIEPETEPDIEFSAPGLSEVESATEPPEAEPVSGSAEVASEMESPEVKADTEFSEIEPETDSPPEPELAPSSSRLSPPPLSPAEPRVLTESRTPDFSQQIEGMTQEWSKQLLQTTYASMDKMIKAIGDLAPTIVNQVAREVIPPLAEKVIKAEIARLEEQLQLEEAEDDKPQ